MLLAGWDSQVFVALYGLLHGNMPPEHRCRDYGAFVVICSEGGPLDDAARKAVVKVRIMSHLYIALGHLVYYSQAWIDLIICKRHQGTRCIMSGDQ
jgi:hypothetical protein